MTDTPQTPPVPRTLEFEVEVVGTPEEVWAAVATGPGITSWYVPHTVEERQDGAMSAAFGPGPEMQVPGRVAAWEPPHRFMVDGGDGVEGLAFEWLIEARDSGTCIVRLVNSGFGDGGEWDDQYDGMSEGWKLFLLNLQLHLKHFKGRTATPILPTAMWAGPRNETWKALTGALGLPSAPTVGERVKASGGAPPLAGTVMGSDSWRLALLLDSPAPGTAVVAVEGDGPAVNVSVWSYLYDEVGAAAATDVEPQWWEWLNARAIPPKAATE